MIMLESDPLFDGRRTVLVNLHGAVSTEWARHFFDSLCVFGLNIIFIGNRQSHVDGADYYVYFNENIDIKIAFEKYTGLDEFQNILANAAAVISTDVNVVKICVDMGLPLAFLASMSFRPKVLAYEVRRAVKKRYPITLRERLGFIAGLVVIDLVKNEAYEGKQSGLKEVPISKVILG